MKAKNEVQSAPDEIASCLVVIQQLHSIGRIDDSKRDFLKELVFEENAELLLLVKSTPSEQMLHTIINFKP